ncbi:MAG: vitamin K epoxide reductase family protein [Nanoarchaeota archaeon]
MIKREKIIQLLLILNFILCIYLVYDQSQQQGYCIIGSSCNQVWNSPQAHLLGIPMSWFGLFAFLLFFIMHEFKSKNIWIERGYVLFVGAGAVMALYLIIVQAFVIHAFCTICTIIDSIMIVIAILASEDIKDYVKK